MLACEDFVFLLLVDTSLQKVVFSLNYLPDEQYTFHDFDFQNTLTILACLVM